MADVTTRPRRRRRCGEVWELWRVHSWAAVNEAVGEAVGYLVTGRGRFPKPVAYVPGIGRSRLRKAQAIRSDRRRIRRALDVVRCCLRQFPPALFGLPLLPVDGLDQVVRGDTYQAGAYLPAETGQSVGGFCIFVHDVLKMPAQEKSGSPAVPVAPRPGSKKGGKVRALTAA